MIENLDLSGRVALVTGGSRGIGAATCRAFAAAGASVAVNGRDHAAVAAVTAAITGEGGTALAVPGDVTDETVLAGLRERIEDGLGPVDVLAAFAGGNGTPAPTAQLGAARWRAVLDADLTSLFLTVAEFLPGMIERGRGSIVTMSSAAGRHPSRANIAYATAKAGVVMFTRHLAAEAGRHRVRVNCLAPAAVRTERMERFMTADQLDGLASSFPLGRIGLPRDVAEAALFLASDRSSWITGTVLDLTGGRVAA